MREIKFRAWDKEEERIRDWKNLLAIGYGPNKIMDSEIDDSIFNDDQFQLMQFTGLYDRHGKEIYEGDILKWKCSHGAISGGGKVKLHKVTIEWGHLTSAHGYSLTIHKGGEKYAVEKSYWNKEDREIIGNIYENPELIKA
jgi:uncharacterized phage protein (TIGR01671 family)